MSIQVVIGRPLPLRLQLDGGETDKFPRARVYDQDNVQVPGSPFALSHVSNGFYSSDAYVVQAADRHLFAEFSVYDDAGFVVPSYEWPLVASEEKFDIDLSQSATESNVTFDVSVPDVLQIPLLGSTQYRFVVYVFDAFGSPVDPDGNQVFIHIEDINNGEVVPEVAITREQVGVYFYKYTVNSTDSEQPLWAEFSFNYNTIPHLIGRVTSTVRVRSQLELITTQRLTAVRAANLDNLDVAISTRESIALAQTRQTAITAEINANEAKIDTLTTKVDNLTVAVQSVKTSTDKIGNPVYGTLAQDNAVAYAQLTKIGAPHTGTLAGDIHEMIATLGSPVHGSISQDLAFVASQTALIGSPATTIAGDIAALNGKLGNPVSGTVSGDISALQGTSNFIRDLLGLPQGATVSEDIFTLLTGLNTLLSRLSSARASNLDNLDVPVSSRESEADALSRYNSEVVLLNAILGGIGAIPNNTTFVGIVPPILVQPESGSKPYKFYVNLFNQQGVPEDADLNTISIRIENVNGNVVVGTQSMLRIDTGRYYFAYPVNWNDPERTLYVFFDYTQNSIAYHHVRMTEVQEFESKLDLLVSRLTETRALNLDKLDATISSRQSASVALTQYTQLHDDHTLLLNGQTSILATLGDVISDIADVDSVVSRIGLPVTGTLAGDIAQVKSDTSKIGTPAYGSLSGDHVEIILRLSNLLSQLTSVKASTDKIGNPVSGTLAGEFIDLTNLINGLQSSMLSGLATVDSHVLTVDTKVNSVVSLVTNVSSQVNTIGMQVTALDSKVDTQVISKLNTIGSDVQSLLPLSVQVPAIGDDVAELLTKCDAIGVEVSKIGDPVYGSVSEDIAELRTHVLTGPGNPLQANDPRLNFLDAAISSRATPFDILNATQSLNMLEITGILDQQSQSFELIGIVQPSQEDVEIDGFLDSPSAEYELIGIVEDET